MKQHGNIHPQALTPISILLADDDEDDRDLFDEVLRSLPIPTRLTTVEDCEKLLAYLSGNVEKLPDALFLDFNMPGMNGLECLSEMQKTQRLKNLPVIIYSMFIQEDIAELLYNKGVYYHIRKADLPDLKKALHHILNLLIKNNFAQPTREKFMLTLAANVNQIDQELEVQGE